MKASKTTSFFQMKKKKKQKKSPGHLRLCPGPRNAFKDNYLFVVGDPHALCAQDDVVERELRVNI